MRKSKSSYYLDACRVRAIPSHQRVLAPGCPAKIPLVDTKARDRRGRLIFWP